MGEYESDHRREEGDREDKMNKATGVAVIAFAIAICLFAIATDISSPPSRTSSTIPDPIPPKTPVITYKTGTVTEKHWMFYPVTIYHPGYSSGDPGWYSTLWTSISSFVVTFDDNTTVKFSATFALMAAPIDTYGYIHKGDVVKVMFRDGVKWSFEEVK